MNHYVPRYMYTVTIYLNLYLGVNVHCICILSAYGPVSLVITVKDNPKLLLITVRSEVYLMSWDSCGNDSALRLLTAVDLGHPDNRCNDGKVDARGRLWLGKSKNKSAL